MPLVGLEPGPFDPESSALTTGPLTPTKKVNALYKNEKKLHGVRHFGTVTFFAIRTVLYCDFFLKLTISLIKLIQKTHKKRSVTV